MRDFERLDGWTLTLDPDNNPVPCDVFVWNDMLHDVARRTVGHSYVGSIEIISVFFGYDQDWWSGNARPKTLRPFGTLVSQGDRRVELRTYSTWAEASRGHAEITALVRALAAGDETFVVDDAQQAEVDLLRPVVRAP
jgi:hypothetical protein